MNYCLALREILGIASSGPSLKRTLNAIARRTATAMGARGCSIMLLDPQRKYLVRMGSYGLSDMYLKKGSVRARHSLPAILEGKVVAVSDALKDENVEHREAARSEGIASILGAPVTEKGEVIGELRVYTRERRRFTADDKDFARTVASVSSLVLERAEMGRALANGEAETSIPAAAPVTPHPTCAVPAPSSFAHPSEAEFARLLDFYRIEWLYEPRSFPIRWDGDRVVEMFTPDFYLPEMDMYVELTTMKQKLITDKNRKVRRLRELHPEVKIRLLNKNDYVRLLGKYGYGPAGDAKVRGVSQVMFSQTQIQRRVNALARQISKDYGGKQIVLLGILKGVVPFMSDLMRRISLPATVDFMAISYFTDDAGKAVTITKGVDTNIEGQDVIMVEDIVDTGMTLNYVLEHLRAKRPASLRVCALLDKRVRRLIELKLDYVGFEVPDEFLVGYGLDYKGQYRNLPFIGVLAREEESDRAEGEQKRPK